MNAARTDKRFVWLACLALAAGTLALYWPVTGFPFINFDDNEYITDNPVTTAGLTWHGLVWAFNGIHVGNWHPLSWLSHMLDCQLFGTNAGGHHLVNVLYHTANTLLLFAFLRSTTGMAWRSALVAALFAWHPLHVESVAWVAERKDVLSTFFWLLTMICYARYAQAVPNDPKPATGDAPKCQVRRVTHSGSMDWPWCAPLALLSKPMAVTLPFTLLLLDWWPLGRMRGAAGGGRKFVRLIVEKIPFFALSLALCTVTFLVQRTAGAVSPVEWSSRLGNVPVAYLRYLSKTLWPTDLAIVYPYVYHWPVSAIAGSVVFLLVFSGLALGFSAGSHGWLRAGSGFSARWCRSSALCRSARNPWRTATATSPASGCSSYWSGARRSCAPRGRKGRWCSQSWVAAPCLDACS
jgi:hypothetical protein